MKKAFLYLTFLLTGMLSVSLLHGQTIRGVVTDQETGETLPGATILVKGTTIGTTTGMDGEYSLEVTPGTYTMTFRFIGFSTKEIEISISEGESITRNVELVPETITFDEFVVIGYGTQQKRVVTGAISSIDSEEITSIPVLRLEQAMQGRTAGVQVTNLSGQPGEPPTVRVRGAGTTLNPEPLYIVDGMAVENINFLNPSDIESMDVLKDAASAAIYGARAANGVILITTKSGQEGEMRINYSGYHGFQNAAHTVDLLDAEQYRMMMNEGARNAGLTEPFDLDEIPQHNTNWQEELFENNAPMMSHDISVSGGSDRSVYNSSLSYFSQQGIIGADRSQFDRVTARLNTRHDVNDFFNFGNNLAYTHISQRGIASNAAFNAAYSSALNLDPLTPLYIDDEDILNQEPYSTEPVVTDDKGRVFGISELLGTGGEIVNPVALIHTQTGETRTDRVVGNIFGELEPLDHFQFRTSLGIDLSFVTFDNHTPLFYLNAAQSNTGKTNVSKNIDRYYSWEWENVLSYSRKIDDHNFSVLAGLTARKENFESLFGFNAMVDITDPDHVYLNMATDTVWEAYGGAAHASLYSQFGRILYDYRSTYSINATLRRDGSSRFGPENRFGIFPSVGLAWAISYEDFFPDLGPIEMVKLRASWGINGNQNIGNYQYFSRIDRSRSYIFGAGRAIGASPLNIENPEIRWEESEQIDIGLDFGAFDNRLTGTFDYYVKTTKGLLEVIPIPAHVGNNPSFANVGSVENRGIELSLDWRNYGRDFRYSLGINTSYNINEMTKIGNEEGIIRGATWAVAGFVTRAKEGYPIGHFWGFKTDGIFQNWAEVYQHINEDGDLLQPDAQPGDVRFVDVNGDGRISDDDRTIIGSPTPDVTLGMNANFEYRQFDLSFLLTGSYGNDIFNGMIRPDLRYTNRTTEILNRWTGEGTSDRIPRYTWIDANNNNRISDLYIEDGSFLRVRNLQVGYSFDPGVLSRIRAHSWRVYFSVENLYTLTRYTGSDPEIGAITPFDSGIDRGVYPHARTFRLGTNIAF